MKKEGEETMLRHTPKPWACYPGDDKHLSKEDEENEEIQEEERG